MRKNILLLSTLFVLGLCSCKDSTATTGETPSTYTTVAESTNTTNKTETTISVPPTTSVADYDAASDIIINLSNATTVSNNNGCVVVLDNIVWILGGGVYTLSGSLEGQVIVSAPDEAVELELKNVSISSSTSCPLFIYEAGDCEISAKRF